MSQLLVKRVCLELTHTLLLPRADSNKGCSKLLWLHAIKSLELTIICPIYLELVDWCTGNIWLENLELAIL